MTDDHKDNQLFSSVSETADPGGSVLSPVGDVVPVDNDGEDNAADSFDWSNESEGVVLQDQKAIAVYQNKFGGIVIRREQTEFEREDAVVILATSGAAYRLIDAIQRELDALKAERKNGDASK